MVHLNIKMPQQIRVLQCVKCSWYQVDIVKKVNKWECKMCCLKQSVFKEFFRGTGAECRAKVQQLNHERGKNQPVAYEQEAVEQVAESTKALMDSGQPTPERQNKWSNFVDDSESFIMENQKTSVLVTRNEREPFPIKRSRHGSSNRSVAAKKTCSKWQEFM